MRQHLFPRPAELCDFLSWVHLARHLHISAREVFDFLDRRPAVADNHPNVLQGYLHLVVHQLLLLLLGLGGVSLLFRLRGIILIHWREH